MAYLQHTINIPRGHHYRLKLPDIPLRPNFVYVPCWDGDYRTIERHRASRHSLLFVHALSSFCTGLHRGAETVVRCLAPLKHAGIRFGLHNGARR